MCKTYVNQVIVDRLSKLREAMVKENIDFYMIPTADYHNSEYVDEYFKVRKYFSNFSGSNGNLLVWKDGAGLWTDGRYFIQAEKELKGTGITLFRMLDDGVPTINEFILSNIKDGQTLGFDGRVINTNIGRGFEKELAGKSIHIKYEKDLAPEIWTDRPDLPSGRITVLDEELTGKTTIDKLDDVRAKMKEVKATGFLLTKLDDIMWLFNIRGCDVKRNPVALSYAYITETDATIYIQDKALDDVSRDYFRGIGVIVKEYDILISDLKELSGVNILIDCRYISYAIYKAICDNNELIEKYNPTEIMKAIKNPTEIANMRDIYLKDSVAVTKFIYWVKKNIGKIPMTEISASDYLEDLRRKIPGFLDLSFDTIAGYKANAAMMHYTATEDNYAVLEPEGMLLVDSGGQYLGGTTDVTRTIVLGEISDEIKRHYTLVAVGMLELTNANWLYGCSGRNLDILARKPLWDIGMDYKCGTGHGVGYILNVHEGPQNLRWKYTDGLIEVPFEDGMDITNEPGVYIEGSHGIRIENVLIAHNGEKNEYGQFMYFETLTFAPIDPLAMDTSYMTDAEIEMYNKYQQSVYEKISPYLDAEEAKWLKEETAPLKK